MLNKITTNNSTNLSSKIKILEDIIRLLLIILDQDLIFHLLEVMIQL